MNIEEIIKKPEGKCLEFKENYNSRSKIVATIIAFANTAGGHIVIGVQDKTRYITGIEDPQLVAEALANLINDAIEPKIVPNIEVLSYRNVNLVTVEVYPSPLRPHYERSKGKLASTYIRLGSTNRLADQALLNIIERSVITKSLDEEPCYAASYADLDIAFAAQLFEKRRKLEKNDLLTLWLVIKNGDLLIPTVGGIILFSPDRLRFFPDAWIQLGAFDGTNKVNIVNSQSITTSLITAVDEALLFIICFLLRGIPESDCRLKTCNMKKFGKFPRLLYARLLLTPLSTLIIHCEERQSG